MRAHSYIVEHDMGFAPNPFHGACTLAACKPRIRRYAKIDEYVLGTGTKKRSLEKHLVYVMKISEIIGFDDYWKDRRFVRKRTVTNGSLVQRYGDNIYHIDAQSKRWVQEHSFHSKAGGVTDPDNLRLDTGSTDRVLIGDWFIYWGGDGPEIPDRFEEFIHEGIGHHYIDDDAMIQKFIAWAVTNGAPGVRGDPCEWKHPRRKTREGPIPSCPRWLSSL
jgi:hypothetical protein